MRMPKLSSDGGRQRVTGDDQRNELVADGPDTTDNEFIRLGIILADGSEHTRLVTDQEAIEYAADILRLVSPLFTVALRPPPR